MDTRAAAAQHALDAATSKQAKMEEEIARLREEVYRQFNSPTSLLDQASQQIGQNASSVMDRMVRDLMRADGAKRNEEAKQSLRDEGISDKDIAAAEKLLRGVREGDLATRGMTYKGKPLGQTASYGIDELMTREEVNAAMREDLKIIVRGTLTEDERTTVSRVRG